MPNDLTILSQAGGYNDHDPAISLPQDQCVEAVNVEFFQSMLGERRAGGATVTIAGSGLENQTHLAWMHRHIPLSGDETAAQLWAFSVTPGGSAVLAYKDTAWHTVSPPHAFLVNGTDGLTWDGKSIHGKLFITARSAVDRLHVYDGMSLRYAGVLAPTAAPTAVDSGGAGTLGGIRYYRVRYTVQSAGKTLRRSEPSAMKTFTPGGANASVTITKPPASADDNETHWELEASIDNTLFYVLATQVVATTTYTDSTSLSTGYSAGVLSDLLGTYTAPYSPKFLSTDQDRVLMAGSREQTALGSRVSWTVVYGDTTGVGNDERIPVNTVNFKDLDASEGGDITGMSEPVNGYIFVFKYQRMYKLVRTGQLTNAYDAVLVTTRRGAIQGSVVEGIDHRGNPAMYWLDPRVGPCSYGLEGLQTCGLDILTTWKRANINATQVVARGLFIPDKTQVVWWVAVDGGNTPTLEIVLQTDRMELTMKGLRKGWAQATGLAASAISATLYATNINSGAARSLTLVPFIGLTGANASILQLGTGVDDAGTPYFAHVLTRPYALAGILNKMGVMAGALLAKAISGVTVFVNAVRNFGVETSATTTASLTPAGSETQVVPLIDDLNFSDMKIVQFKYGDDPAQIVTPVGNWEVYQMAFKPRPEDTA